jgi:hypothetical protein
MIEGLSVGEGELGSSGFTSNWLVALSLSYVCLSLSFHVSNTWQLDDLPDCMTSKALSVMTFWTTEPPSDDLMLLL